MDGDRAPAPAAGGDAYRAWVREHDTLTAEDRRLIRAHVDLLPFRPVISVVVPPARGARDAASREAAVASLRAQLYPHWELCAAAGEGGDDDACAAANAALASASGEFVALLRPGDVLAEHALYEVAAEIAARPDADLVYTDEDEWGPEGRSNPVFKPMWSPELLASHDAIGGLAVYRRALLERLGGLRPGLAGAEHWDLALRATAAASAPGRVRHVPAVLCHRRRLPGEAPPDDPETRRRRRAAGRRAVRDHLDAQGAAGARVEDAPSAPGRLRVVHPLPDPAPLVSVIVPTRDKAALLDGVCAGVLRHTAWPPLELLLVDNGSVEPDALALLSRLEAEDGRVRVLRRPGPFNYPRLNNEAAREARGDVLVLLNNDIEVVEPGWLEALVRHALRPDVGIVGAKLLYPDGRLQHGGIVAGPAGAIEHTHRFAEGEAQGYLGQVALARALCAVTGACVAMRRAVYEEVGGLDEALAVSFNDIDLCFRVADFGYRVVWTPDAVLTHLESASRGYEIEDPARLARARSEWAFMRRRWGRLLDEDPHHNPNVLLHAEPVAVPCPPRRQRPWRRAPAPSAGAAAPLPEPGTDYDRWVRDHDTLTDDDRAAIRAHIGRLGRKPLISVVMPAYETRERFLREAVASIQAQLYQNWELCVADDASPSDTVVRVLREAAASDPRIKWVRRESNGHIVAATNSALALASGEFVALMDHDDLLPEHALYEVAVELDAHPDADLVFSDEDLLSTRGKRHTPYFKTGWNPDLMLGHNAVSHLGVYRRALVERLGGLRPGFEGSQDYDLALRVAAASDPARIRHIPAVLYHWRTADEASSFSQTQLDRCVAAARRAISEHLHARGGPAARAEVLPAPAVPSWTRVRWPLPDPPPPVSLVVPTRDRADLLARCAAGLLHRTDYPDLELLIADNGSTEPDALALLERLRRDERVRVLPVPGPFNYSALNNAAAREAKGRVLVLLNNDTDVIGADWLREMVSQALRPDVGAVGAKLLYADGRVQHGGVLLGIGSFNGGPGVAGHTGVLVPREEIGYFGNLSLVRNFSAVTAACLALRREVFDAVGGFDEVHLPVAFNDVDLCLRIGERGLRIVWTPFAELHHLESASRGSDIAPERAERFFRECSYMRERWGEVLDGDPFLNPNLTRDLPHTTPAFPPRRVKPWRRAAR